MKGRLKVDSFNRRVIETEAHDPADLAFIDAALDSGHQDHGAPDLSQTVECADFCGQNVGLAANNSVSFALETVELEIDVGPQLG